MSNQNLIIELKDSTQIITLNRPNALNAFNKQMRAELEQAIDDAEADKKVKVVVVTGNGRALGAGKDLPEFVGNGGDGMAADSREDHRVFGKIRNLTKPVIAAINGIALGGGLELAMSCHIRVAADTAIMGQPEVGLGGIPGAGGTQLLPRLIGTGAALYYLLTGENISAQEAYRLGLVDKVVSADKLMVTALAIAKVIGRKGPIASKLILEAVIKGMRLTLDEGLELEAEQWRICGTTKDWNEAIKSFMEKKPVVFRGE
jgi:enoyl-CoA hydratase/carnithine racemase